MTSSESSLRAALRAQAHAARQQQLEHPTLDDLAAYHDDQLSTKDAESIQAHLVDCQDCATIVLELAAGTTAEAEVSDFEMASAWKEQRERLLQQGVLPAAELKRPLIIVSWAWTTAAALALLTVGLSVWIASLHQTVRELRTPQVNPPVLNLGPIGAVRDVASPVPTLELPPGVTRSWLILNLFEEPKASSYRVEFMAADRRLKWVHEGIEKGEANNFRIEIPADFLPAGQYRIVLSGLLEERYEPIAEYRLRVGGL